ALARPPVDLEDPLVFRSEDEDRIVGALEDVAVLLAGLAQLLRALGHQALEVAVGRPERLLRLLELSSALRQEAVRLEPFPALTVELAGEGEKVGRIGDHPGGRQPGRPP